MYIEVANSVNFTRGVYTFTVKVTADGGEVHYTDFTLNVIYDCIYDNITFVRSIPTSNFAARDMVMVGDHPVTYVSGTVGVLEYYLLDLNTIFTNNPNCA